MAFESSRINAHHPPEEKPRMIRLANFARWIGATNTGTNIDSGREQTHSARAACPLYKGKEQIKLGLKAATVEGVTGSSPGTFHGGKFFLSSRRGTKRAFSHFSPISSNHSKTFEWEGEEGKKEDVGERIAMELDERREQGDPSLVILSITSNISPLSHR